MEVVSWIGSSASMSGYMNAIKVAVLTFPFLAFLITIPYMISQYRKYGAIHSLRTLIIYSFVLYLLAAYFLVILPLPSMEVVESLATSQTQLVPFAFIGDMVRESHFVWDDPSTYLGAILNPSVYVVLYNILLTIPFGMYLRYYFKKDLKTTILYSFLLSLFFELTQLSGLYFIYPRGYRLFDVDDLILNTSGGCVGYFLGGLLTLFLPKREEIDARSYESGKHISFFRRMMSVGFDGVLYLLFSSISYAVFKNWLILYFVYFILFPFICNGKTFGQMYMKIQMVTKDNQKVKLLRLTIRQFSCLFVYILFPFLLLYLIRSLPFVNENVYTLCLICSSFVMVILYFVSFIRLLQKKTLIHEMITGTKMISIIQHESIKKNEDTSTIEEETLEKLEESS